MSNSNPLDPTSLVDLAKRLVHPSTTLTSPTQALALLIHSIHSSLSFRLISPKPASTPSDAQGQAGEEQHHPNRLPETWPQQGGELKFRYKHEQSSLEFVITVVELGDRALVAGAAVDNPRSSSSFDLPLVDYFSRTSLSPTSPLSVTHSLSPSLPFSAPHRLADLILLYRLNVLQKLIPGLRKEGYSEVDEADLAASASGSRDPPGVTPRFGGTGGGGGARTGEYLPDGGGPMGMFPPPGRGGGGAPDNDPLRIPGTGGRGGFPGGSTPLAEIGRRDLDPLGGMGGTFGGGGFPGGLGGFGGGFGGGGVGGLGGGDNGGGMFMGPNHPLFRERFGLGGVGGGVGGGAQGEGRRWGGDGYLPPGGAPPGARFDPVGPVNGPPGGSGLGIGPGQAGFHPGPGGGAQGQGGQGGQGGVGGMRGMGGGGRGVHPDLERPGGNSDYDAMFG